MRYGLLQLQTLKAPTQRPTCSARTCSVGSSFLGESSGENIKARKLIMVDWEQGALHQEDLNVSNSEDCQSQVIMQRTFEVEKKIYFIDS